MTEAHFVIPVRDTGISFRNFIV